MDLLSKGHMKEMRQEEDLGLVNDGMARMIVGRGLSKNHRARFVLLR